MKKISPAIFVISVFVIVSAFVLADSNPPRVAPVVANPEMMDQLTDELLYLVQLSDAAEKQIYDDRYRELAAVVKAEAMAGNRKLCSLIIEHQIPARRELHERHRQGIFSIVSLNRQELLTAQYEQLLQEELDYIDHLLTQHEGLPRDTRILEFYRELKNRSGEFDQKLKALGGQTDLLVQR